MPGDQITNERDIRVGDDPAAIPEHVHGSSVAGLIIERKAQARVFA
jgi:hypothetical protein